MDGSPIQWQNCERLLTPMLNERVMQARLHHRILNACFSGMLSLLATVLTIALSIPASAEAQKDTNACLRTSNALYKRGEELHKKKRWEIPREFARVASNLDEYCRDKEFKKADISIEWLNTCLRNYDKPYDQGYCTRSKKYFCAIDSASEACRTAQ
jgi:hypothetical protein